MASFKCISCRLSLSQFNRRALPLIILFCLLFNGVFRHWRSREILQVDDSLDDFFIPQAVEEGDDYFNSEAIEEEELLDLGASGTSPGWLLIEETRTAIVEAGGLPGSVMPPQERKAWDAANNCIARKHLLWLWTKQKRASPPLINTTTTHQGSEPSILLQVLFNEYANLHRTCTHGGNIEYVTELFNSGNESSTPCKFLVVEFGTYGVGNRLLWLVSVYQYALLTKRVLLIDTRSTVHEFLCEPFAGSSWALSYDFRYSSDHGWPMPNDFHRVWDKWENGELVVQSKTVYEKNPDKDGLQFLGIEDIAREKRDNMARIRAEILSRANEDRLSNTDKETVTHNLERRLMAGEESASGTSSPEHPYFHHTQANDGWAPHPRFFCNNEREHLRQVKWISFSKGCLYFLPDLFAVPSFQPVLEDLFPNRDPVTHLLRQLTLPVDSIWAEVRDVYTKEFRRASKVVGMQVRYRDGMPMYRTLNSLVNQRISKCGQIHGLIPNPAAASPVNQSDGPLVIFIASLYPGLRKHLEIEYGESLKKKKGMSESLKLVQLSRFGFQSFDLECDRQAFLEIICLSLVDELLTSPQSTYGQIAQALGGLTPWLIDFEHPGQGESSRNCVRGQSTDACFQFPISKFTCPFNNDVHGKEMAELAPYLKPCQDLTDGLQLVPPWSPSLLP